MVLVESVAIALTVSGWVVTPTINRLIDKAQGYVSGSKYKWHKEVPEKLESVARFLEEVRVTASLVEEQRINFMQNWLSLLIDAIEEVEDIFGEFDYQILKHSIAIANRSSQPSSSSSSNSAQSTESATELISNNASFERLNKVVKKLDDICQSSRSLVQASLLAAATARCSRRRPPATGPLLAHDKLFGYGGKYRKLVRRLLAVDGGNNRDARVVAVVGYGGMGKTTLAQRACNDVHVTRHFDIIIWASVHNMPGEAELLGEIWESAIDAAEEAATFRLSGVVKRLKRMEISSVWGSMVAAVAGSTARRADKMSFGSIQRALEKLVASRRFLLVLDDVCNDETATELQRRQTWSNVLAPFKHGREGSKILVTTRATICAETMDAGSTISLDDGIIPKQLLLILEASASEPDPEQLLQGHRAVNHVISDGELQRLRGSPLAAKEVGFKLRNAPRDSKAWEQVLRAECHENVLLAHMSSYERLPPHLKGCFAFCSLFPINCKFDPEMLVKMWVALGCFIGDGGLDMCNKSTEDVGRGYFSELLARSFFQAKKQGKETHYVIHPHIHLMARSVSARYFLSVDGSHSYNICIPSTVRHLSVTSCCLEALDQLRTHPKLEKLRTLLLFSSSSLTDINNDILERLKGVRVLDLSSTAITKLTEKTSKLIHLRYLGLPSTVISLPAKTTGRLLHLQTFSLRKSCKELDDKLPDDMRNLINLRHLDVDTKYIAKMRGIGTLRKLQGSVEFHVAEHNSINELSGLNSLSTLAIKGLNFVESKQEAETAQIGRKESIKMLKLEWNPTVGVSSSHHDDILEGLQPSASIEELHIITYHGVSSPRWLMDSQLHNLRHLHLINCRKWMALPPLGQFHHLKGLRIKSMHSVSEINGRGLFHSLELLELDDMPNLERWTCTQGADNIFPCLKNMQISNCPSLKSLPPVSSSVKRMEIEKTAQVPENLKLFPSSRLDSCTLRVTGDVPLHERLLHRCHILATDKIYIRLNKGAIDPQIYCFTSLKELILDQCSTKEEQLTRCLQELRCLTTLRLMKCSSITAFSFPEGSEHLPVLQNLEIQHCRSMSSLFGLEHCHSLRSLSMEDCPALTAASLPANFTGLSFLKEMRICNCYGFQEIPEGGMPPCLESLKMKGCDPQLMKQLRNKTGIAWQRISSMPPTFTFELV